MGQLNVIEEKETLMDQSVRLKETPMKLSNSLILNNINEKLNHLPKEKKDDLIRIIKRTPDLFSDVPRKTNVITHDVELTTEQPIRQHPYRVNPRKKEIINKEIEYMLENKIISPSQSEWASPCVLVDKPDGSIRFCTDYRKLNEVTRADSYPIPRMEDCIDQIGNAKYITKCDLLKGYRSVPLTERAKLKSAFVVPGGKYHYNVMPFGMQNSQATFTRLMNRCLANIPNVSVYIDDIVIYNESWEEHINSIEQVFQKLNEANLTINLEKATLGKQRLNI